jgi:hypothetical protein
MSDSNIASGVEKPCEKKRDEYKGLKALLISIFIGIPVLFVVLISSVAALTDGSSKSKKSSPELGPYETVNTESVTLKPGESEMLKTFIPGKSEQLDYLFEFTQASEQSIVDYSLHGKNGEFGGDKVGGPGWCRPAEANTILGDGEKNRQTFYIRIKNGGKDDVSFNFHLKGYRRLSPPLEK